jgi:hypothetical protein
MASYPQALFSLVLRFNLWVNVNYCTDCKNVCKTILNTFTAVFRVCGFIAIKKRGISAPL